jgi:hypothetical protein
MAREIGHDIPGGGGDEIHHIGGGMSAPRDIGDGLIFDPRDDVTSRVEKYNASERINPRGQIGMTAEHHQLLGSTPNDRLAGAEPGKTEADIRKPEEIIEWLARDEVAIEDWRDKAKDGGFAESYLQAKLGDHEGDKAYLTRTGRLPDDEVVRSRADEIRRELAERAAAETSSSTLADRTGEKQTDTGDSRKGRLSRIFRSGRNR